MLQDFFAFIKHYFWLNDLGWLNLLAFLAAVLTHEYGHYLMAYALGLKPKHPKIIPFIGAYLNVENTSNSLSIYKVALGGPLLGGCTGIISFYLYQWTNSPFLYQLALFSLCINAANLTPMPFLDGGRIIKVLGLGFMHYFFGLTSIIAAFVFRNYIFAIVGLIWLGLYLFFEKKQDKSKAMPTYQLIITTLFYFSVSLCIGGYVFLILKH